MNNKLQYWIELNCVKVFYQNMLKLNVKCWWNWHLVAFPVLVGLDTPVDTQGEHEEQNRGPKNPSNDGLVGGKDINQTLNGWVFGVVEE